MNKNVMRTLNTFTNSDKAQRMWNALMRTIPFKSFYDDLQIASKTVWVCDQVNSNIVIYNIDKYYVIAEKSYAHTATRRQLCEMIMRLILENPISNCIYKTETLSWFELITKPFLKNFWNSEYFETIAKDIESWIDQGSDRTVENYVKQIEEAKSETSYYKVMAKLLKYYFNHFNLSSDDRAYYDEIFNKSINYLFTDDDYWTDAVLSLYRTYYYVWHKKGPKINYYIYKKR